MHGAPADPFGVAALGPDRGAAGVQVEVFDVQRQDFAGAGGGFVEHPPQGLLPQRNVAAGQRPVDRRPGHSAGGVEVLAAPFGAGRQTGPGSQQAAHQDSQAATAPRLRFQVAGAGVSAAAPAGRPAPPR